MNMWSRMWNSNERDDLEIWLAPVLANLFWLALMLPIVTAPLAIVGLMGSIFHWIRRRSTAVPTLFFGTIRHTWRRAYLVALLDVIVGGLLYFNVVMFQVIPMTNVLAYLSRSFTLLAGVVFIVINIHVWVLVAIWDVPLPTILRAALKLTFVQPLWSLGIGMLVVAALSLSSLLPGVVLIAATGAVAAYIACHGTWFLIGKYIVADQFELIDVMPH